MLKTVGLAQLVTEMQDFLKRHGDMPVMFIDARGGFSGVVGQSLGSSIDDDDKMFILRGYDMGPRATGVPSGKTKNI